MYDVLRSKAARDDYEKCLNYLQILRRYLVARVAHSNQDGSKKGARIETLVAQ